MQLSPAPSAEAPWQQPFLQRLHTLESSGRLPHALLIAAARGLGKKEFAANFAAWLLCESHLKVESELACGTCKNCELLAADTHPDLHYLLPEENSRVIKVDQLRSLAEHMAKKPHIARRKLVIINLAESMNVQAANAFLKILEEPTDDTVYLLLSENTGLLLATIKSRCQIYRLPAPSPAELKDWLRTKLTTQQSLEDSYIERLISAAGRQPYLALSLHEQHALNLQDDLAADLNQLLRGQTAVSMLSQKWQQEDQELLLSWLQIWLSDLLRYRNLAVSEEALVHYLQDPHMLPFYRRCRTVSLQRVFDSLDLLKDIHAMLYSPANPNRQLLLDKMFLDIQGWAKQS